jgi:prevent-host-death family protein
VRAAFDKRAGDLYVASVQIKERAMITVNVTALRNHLPEYLGKVRAGQEVAVTSRGRVVARIVPDTDASARARDALRSLRGSCTIGDIVSPVGERWDADR